MPALGSAWRLVGEDAAPFERVRRDVISDRLQRTCVERAGDAVRSIGAAVENRLEMNAGNRAVVLHTGPEPHEDGVAAAMAIEDFLARQADLHRAIEPHRGAR